MKDLDKYKLQHENFGSMLSSFIHKGDAEVFSGCGGIKIHDRYGPIEVHIIGTHGLAGSGKDTLCNAMAMLLDSENNRNNIESDKPWYIDRKMSFAGPLKRACSEIFGIDTQDFNDRSIKEKDHPYWNMSPRRIAQLVGTEAMREGFDKDIWIKSAEWRIIQDLSQNDFGSIHEKIRHIRRANSDKVIKVFIFVSDVRFDNEADWIRSIGGRVVHIERRDNNIKVPDHASENGVEYHPEYGDIRIDNNKTLNEFVCAAKQLFREIYISK